MVPRQRSKNIYTESPYCSLHKVYITQLISACHSSQEQDSEKGLLPSSCIAFPILERLEYRSPVIPPNRVPFDLVRWGDIVFRLGPQNRIRRGINHYGNLFVQYVFSFSPEGGKGHFKYPIWADASLGLACGIEARGREISWTFIFIKGRLQWL